MANTRPCPMGRQDGALHGACMSLSDQHQLDSITPGLKVTLRTTIGLKDGLGTDDTQNRKP